MNYQCNKVLYFDIIQFGIICVFEHPRHTYMSTWFCYSKLGATLNPQMVGHTIIYRGGRPKDPLGAFSPQLSMAGAHRQPLNGY